MEFSLAGSVAGVDEAGAGPLAGPVYAAAVIIPDYDLIKGPLKGVNDSKKLSHRKRMAFREEIERHCIVSIGSASAQEIDEINILQARLLAMVRAVAGLRVAPDHALIDGNIIPKGLPCPATAVVKGDSISLSIAAASIVAKTARDTVMLALDREFPEYGWAKNSGYGTAVHRDAILRLGVTPHHRMSFAGLSELAR
jgi:ribonuclease HII